MKRPGSFRPGSFAAVTVAAFLLGAAGALSGVCGPFTDVSDPSFCPFVLEIFTLGITTGTTPATYDPASNVSRLQMAAFLSRTVDSVSVVRASSGVVLATLTGNGLSSPFQAAFDGQRVLLTNNTGPSVSLFKAADLTALGSFPMPVSSLPLGACGDGVSFWIALSNTSRLARF